ncbi:MAG: site-specific tyrosine recombinase XerC [Burkholderiales bacterium]|jgi:integrase/recombinase XerD
MIDVRQPGQTTARSRQLASPRTPDSVAAWLLRYLDALEVRQTSAAGLRSRKSNLAHFNAWCVDHGIEQPAQVTHAQIEGFARHLFVYRRRDGQPLSASGQVNVLSAVGGFFSWMVKHRHLPSNPASDIELPRTPKGLRDPMTASEIEAVLALPDISYAQGLRDRAVLELLYGTGIRRMELAALNLADIEGERGALHVRRGKGGKGRFVPIGERALAWVMKYARQARPMLQRDPHEPALFLNIDGGRLSMNALSGRVRQYLDKAGIHKAGACHLFRHTMATAMLDNGADVRHVQEMLGHADIGTTQHYTKVSIAKLRAVHAATHPAAQLTRGGSGSDADEAGDPDEALR